MAVSKIIAGRPKDTDFGLSVIQFFGVRPEQIEALFEEYIEEHPGEKEKASVNLSVFKHKIG